MAYVILTDAAESLSHASLAGYWGQPCKSDIMGCWQKKRLLSWPTVSCRKHTHLSGFQYDRNITLHTERNEVFGDHLDLQLSSIWRYGRCEMYQCMSLCVSVGGQRKQCLYVLYLSKRHVIEWSDECGKPCDEQVTGNKISYLSLSNRLHEMIYTHRYTHTSALYTHVYASRFKP